MSLTIRRFRTLAVVLACVALPGREMLAVGRQIGGHRLQGRRQRHLSGGVGIGSVLEPMQAGPTIISA
jgi:hypothetical protein